MLGIVGGDLSAGQLLVIPLAAHVWNVPTFHLWAAIFGLNFTSTVPPPTTLTRNNFPAAVGRRALGRDLLRSPRWFAAIGAALAGSIFEWQRRYDLASVSRAVLAFAADGLTLAIREAPGPNPAGPGGREALTRAASPSPPRGRLRPILDGERPDGRLARCR